MFLADWVIKSEYLLLFLGVHLNYTPQNHIKKEGMYLTIIISFVITIFFFVMGYNFAFNTDKTIAKYLSLYSLEKNSFWYKYIVSKENKMWAKICGYGMMLFAGMMVVAIIASILKSLI